MGEGALEHLGSLCLLLSLGKLKWKIDIKNKE